MIVRNNVVIEYKHVHVQSRCRVNMRAADCGRQGFECEVAAVSWVGVSISDCIVKLHEMNDLITDVELGVEGGDNTPAGKITKPRDLPYDPVSHQVAVGSTGRQQNQTNKEGSNHGVAL